MGGDNPKNSIVERMLTSIKKNKRSRQAATAVACLFIVVVVLKACSPSTTPTTTSNNDNNSIQESTTYNDNGGSGIRGKESPFFASPPPTPKICWLQAMPHSSSAFVSTLVARASDKATATNYGNDVTNKDSYSISINPRKDNGPYWAGLGATGSTSERKLPTDYVLTYTRCKTDDSPFLSTLERFIQDCTATFGYTAPHGVSSLTQHSYPPSSVKKSIHLMRNPLTQIITKFQKDIRAHEGNQKWLRTYTDDSEGFSKWCRAEDDLYRDSLSEYFDGNTVSTMTDTMCSHYIAEYIQWHNLAFDVLGELQIPSLIIDHDDLLDDTLETTLDKMLDFLQLIKVKMPEQRLGKEDNVKLSQYLDKSDQKQVRKLVQKLATPTTWEYVQRYFDGL